MKHAAYWHPGEVAAQKRAGSFELMQGIGPRVMHDFIPDQHREFYARLPLAFLGAEDLSGRLWATALFGEPGFISTPDPVTLRLSASLSRADPLTDALRAGREVGMLGIDLATRRRNRLNGTVVTADTQQISLSVKQSFGNCPKYIQLRERQPNPGYGTFLAHDFVRFDPCLKGFLSASDTFFIASQYQDGERGNNRGIDLSHRGGMPGFVHVADERTLLIPDYSGNNFFNTVGNLMRDPRAALLFCDFAQGDLLHLSGLAQVIWREDEALPFEDVDRMIRFSLEQGRLVENAMPYLYGPAEYSPFNPRPGVTG
jgi:hypothetical protein